MYPVQKLLKLYYNRHENLSLAFYLCDRRCVFPLGNLFLVLWEISLYPLSLPSLFTSNHLHAFRSLTSSTADYHAPCYLPSIPFTSASSDPEDDAEGLLSRQTRQTRNVIVCDSRKYRICLGPIFAVLISALIIPRYLYNIL